MRTLWMVLAAGCAQWAWAGEPLPVEQQNALVQKHCTVCHTDSQRLGGLSLQHFDAASAVPGLKAMMLSKLTGGVPIETVRKAGVDPKAAALVDQGMKSGAFGASGIPRPDKATMDALIQAFAVGAEAETKWSVERANGEVTASILRESGRSASEAEMYRVVVSCRTGSRQGLALLTWAAQAHEGELAVSADGKAPMNYLVKGSERTAGGEIPTQNAAVVLAESGMGWTLPMERLAAGGLFPGETVVFPFVELPKDARRELGACFPAEATPVNGDAGAR